MASANERIGSELIARGITLERFSAGVRGEVRGLLGKLREDLERQINAAALDEAKTKTQKFIRQQALLQQTADTIENGYTESEKLTRSHLVNVADLEQKHVVAVMNRVVGVDVMSVALTPKQLEVLVGKTLVQGAPSADWWARQAEHTTRMFSDQVRVGIAAGETTGDIVRRVRGTWTGKYEWVEDGKGKKRKQPVFSGGVMDVSTRNAEALVRTSVQAVAQETRLQVYEENSDVVDGWSVLTALDGRVCEICMGRSGGAWDFKGNPLPGSAVEGPSPGRPPWHYNDRCQAIPVTKPWSEILGIPGIDEPTPGQQASMDGQVPGDLTFEDWLKKKEAETPGFSDSVLGPGRAQMWKDGQITLGQLVDQSGRPLTLKQLRERTAIPATPVPTPVTPAPEKKEEKPALPPPPPPKEERKPNDFELVIPPPKDSNSASVEERRKKYEEMKKAADAGDPEAAYRLGVALDGGQKGEIVSNPEAAMHYYDKALALKPPVDEYSDMRAYSKRTLERDLSQFVELKNTAEAIASTGRGGVPMGADLDLESMYEDSMTRDGRKMTKATKKLVQGVLDPEYTKEMEKWVASLSKAEYSAVTAYTGGEYDDILKAVRGQPGYFDPVTNWRYPSLKMKHDVVESVIARSPKKEINVYRGAILDKSVRDSLQVGGRWTTNSLTSTSIAKSEAARFVGEPGPDAVMFHMKTRSGAFVGPMSKHPEEAEVLVGSGKSFRITKKLVDEKTGSLSVWLEEE